MLPGVHGILLLDKPLGLTSASAVARVKQLFGMRKAGHMGTLDPLATGLLPVCLGEATKFAGDLLLGAKTYRVEIRLGARTASGDLETEVVESVAVPYLSRDHIAGVLERFPRVLDQAPPMHSAVKQDGTPLYVLARKGQQRDRVARTITVHALELIEWRTPRLTVETRVSKGTYVRVLAEDIARALGTIGHVGALRRVAVGSFDERQAVSLSRLDSASLPARMEYLLPMDSALASCPAIYLTAPEALALSMGREVLPATTWPELHGAIKRARLYAPGPQFIGLGFVSPSGEIHARRMISAHAFRA